MGQMEKWEADLEAIDRINIENEGGDVNAVLEQQMTIFNTILNSLCPDDQSSAEAGDGAGLASRADRSGHRVSAAR
jgi:hypothetical protein